VIETNITLAERRFGTCQPSLEVGFEVYTMWTVDGFYFGRGYHSRYPYPRVLRHIPPASIFGRPLACSCLSSRDCVDWPCFVVDRQSELFALMFFGYILESEQQAVEPW